MTSKKPFPKAGDYWEFKLPGKRKRIKEVGRVGTIFVVIERGTYPKWKDKTKRVPYVHWRRENKGRYTGIRVKLLRQYGNRVSTKAERDEAMERRIALRRAERGLPPFVGKKNG